MGKGGLQGIRRVVLVGAGNVATQMGMALCGAGYEIVQVFSRTEVSAGTLAQILQCPYTTDLNGIVRDADLYIVAVKDLALEKVAHAVAHCCPEALFVHTAGSMPIDVWKGKALHYGVLYPMQTFSKQRKVDFSMVPFFVEGSGREEIGILKLLAEQIGGKVYEATSEQRRCLHVAAVFSCNFTNHMYAVAHHLLEAHGLPFDVMLPLIDETARKVHVLSPVEAQTGPACRDDGNVMRRHLEMLADEPQLAVLYQEISGNIRRYAIEKEEE